MTAAEHSRWAGLYSALMAGGYSALSVAAAVEANDLRLLRRTAPDPETEEVEARREAEAAAGGGSTADRWYDALVQAGYTKESAAEAVAARDTSRLVHTSRVHVRLDPQPDGPQVRRCCASRTDERHRPGCAA